jgi:8-oxo-dGTP diphosphatase
MAERHPYTYCPMCGTRLHEIQRTGALRPVCPACDYTVYYDPKVAVVVFVLRDDKLLLIKRGVPPEQGKWALPAGFVDAGEAPAAAALRETHEETAIRLARVELLDVFGNLGNDTTDILIAYKGIAPSGSVVAQDDAEDARFFGQDELPPTAFETTRILIERWKSGLIR